jgi:hypothetical protein
MLIESTHTHTHTHTHTGCFHSFLYNSPPIYIYLMSSQYTFMESVSYFISHSSKIVRRKKNGIPLSINKYVVDFWSLASLLNKHKIPRDHLSAG